MFEWLLVFYLEIYMMLIQKVIWWLWNQMFQYAFIKALSLRNNVEFKLDLSPYEYYKLRPYELDIFDIKKNYAKINEIPFYERYNYKNRYLNYINNVIIKPFCIKINKNHKIENSSKFDNKFLNEKEWYFDWYFQCEKYFKDFESEIRKDFDFVKPLSKKNVDLLRSLEWKNTVSVHIRRWDYLKLENIYNICWLDYYNKSIQYILGKVKNPHFLFFSDDSKRVKENFKWENYIFIDWNKWEDSWQDMALMSKCKHNIIANSSFSWWWWRLNNNKNKIVIAPKYRWTVVNKDIVPKKWISF